MTIPYLTNCPHSGDGWCLECVKREFEKKMVAPTATEFPWAEVSFRCRKNLKVFFETDEHPNYNKWAVRYRWPLSCEDLKTIGFEKLRMSVRNWGDKCGEEVNTILCRMGFTEETTWLARS